MGQWMKNILLLNFQRIFNAYKTFHLLSKYNYHIQIVDQIYSANKLRKYENIPHNK